MAKFRIEPNTSSHGLARLIAAEKLGPQDFTDIAETLGVKPMRARKIGFVAARKAKTRTEIETRWNGKESTIVAEPGDWIISNMSPKRELMRDGEGHLNVYAIRMDKFPTLYKRDKGTTDEGDVYRAISEVDALCFPGGFEILAPWGETQRADAGYILLNGEDVYGNAKETFEGTYEIAK
jgi:hypothetical protein